MMKAPSMPHPNEFGCIHVCHHQIKRSSLSIDFAIEASFKDFAEEVSFKEPITGGQILLQPISSISKKFGLGGVNKL